MVKLQISKSTIQKETSSEDFKTVLDRYGNEKEEVVGTVTEKYTIWEKKKKKVRCFNYKEDCFLFFFFFKESVNLTHLSMNNKIEEVNAHIFELSRLIAGKT